MIKVKNSKFKIYVDIWNIRLRLFKLFKLNFTGKSIALLYITFLFMQYLTEIISICQKLLMQLFPFRLFYIHHFRIHLFIFFDAFVAR